MLAGREADHSVGIPLSINQKLDSQGLFRWWRVGWDMYNGNFILIRLIEQNILCYYYRKVGGSWLRHFATNRKVAGSILDGVIEFFIDKILLALALGLIQPLTEMSTRNISFGGKGGRYVGLTTLPPSCADCLEIWEPQPTGILRAKTGISLALQKDNS